MRPRLMGLSLMIGTSCWAQVEKAAVPSHAVGRQEVLETLKRQWGLIKTLEVHGEEFVCDAPGARSTREGLTRSEFDFFMAPNAKRALKVFYVFPDEHRELIDDHREDGRRHYQIEAFQAAPERIDRVRVTAQLSTLTSQREMRNCLFVWCWTPNGNALHTYLERDEPLETIKDAEGRVMVRLRVPSQRISLEMDPSHDFALRRCVLSEFEEFVVTRFGSFGGAWLPMEGHRFRYQAKGNAPTYRGFKVREIKVNQALADATFSLPKLPSGAIVSDETGGKSSMEGGIEARRKAQEKFGSNDVKPPAKNAPTAAETETAAVPPSPISPKWSVVLLVTAGAFFLAAWRLMARAS